MLVIVNFFSDDDLKHNRIVSVALSTLLSFNAVRIYLCFDDKTAIKEGTFLLCLYDYSSTMPAKTAVHVRVA